MVKLNNTLKALISCYLVLLQVYSAWCQGISQAVVQINNAAGYRCGGTLITLTHAVTAAHCLPGGTAVAGVNVATPAAGGTAAVTSAVTTIVIHPNYNPTTRDADAAVLTLTTARAAGTPIAPLCTVTWTHNDQITAYAWTLPPTAATVTAPTLNTVPMRVYRRDWCAVKYPTKVNIGHTRMFCGNGDANSICFRDRGGPIEVNGQFCGIMSFAFLCTDFNLPGVFINTGTDGIVAWLRTTAV